MADLSKLIDIAKKLDVPGLAARGVKLAADLAAYAELVRTNAARAATVLANGDQAELDAIHAEALAAADSLDAALAEAEKR